MLPNNHFEKTFLLEADHCHIIQVVRRAPCRFDKTLFF